MGKAIYTFDSEANARLQQGVLKAEGIDSMISPGSAAGDTVFFNVITATDSNYQLIVKDIDAEQALEILKEWNREKI